MRKLQLVNGADCINADAREPHRCSVQNATRSQLNTVRITFPSGTSFLAVMCTPCYQREIMLGTTIELVTSAALIREARREHKAALRYLESADFFEGGQS